MSEPMLMNTEFHDHVVDSIALGRIGDVEDIMGAIVYLASASNLVTGSALMVDGGWTAA